MTIFCVTLKATFGSNFLIKLKDSCEDWKPLDIYAVSVPDLVVGLK